LIGQTVANWIHFFNLHSQLIRRAGFLKVQINFLDFLACLNVLKKKIPLKKSCHEQVGA
jgi:hypothetical protein